MKYILDGYNVIGALNHIQLSQTNKESALIHWIQPFIQPRDHMVIIFDGHHDAFGFDRRDRRKQMTIITTTSDVSADDFIKERYLKKGASIILVTSDNDILYAAKKSGVRYMTAPQFISQYCQFSDPKEGKVSPSITNQHIDFWLKEFGEN